MEEVDLEREFWRHFDKIIDSLKTLEYKNKDNYHELESKFAGIVSFSEYFQSPEKAQEEQNHKQIKAAIVEVALNKINHIVKNLDLFNSKELEYFVEEIILILLFYIDKYGREVKVTAKELTGIEAVVPLRNQVERLYELVNEKGHDYNSGGVSILSYFIWHEKSILHEIHKRALRMLSLSKASDEAKFENAPSSAFDLCAFAFFLLAYIRTVPCMKIVRQEILFPYFQVATLCYLKKNNQTLLVRKLHNNKPSPHFSYNVLGGKVDKDESPLECAIREVTEESGLIPRNLVLKGVVFIAGAEVPEYGIQDWYVFIYKTDDWEGEILTPSNEGVPVWVDDNKILNLLTNKGDKYLLENLEKSGWFEGRIRYENQEVVEVKFYNYNL